MRLYVWGAAPNPRRVRMYLAEKGLSVPTADVGDGAQLSVDYKGKYPFALVPMLELDDGTQIGEAMGGRSHTTVLHGYNKVAEMMEEDDNFRYELMALRERILKGDD